MSNSEIYIQIRNEALQLGFDDIGFASLNDFEKEFRYMHEWVNNGMHGKMDYLSRALSKRKNPNNLMHGAKTAIVVLVNYFPPHMQSSDTYQIAKYAYGKDYHLIIKEKLKILEAKIHYIYGVVKSKIFVDSSGLFEKALAQRAGLGFIGKNTLLINKRLGSFCFIGVILIDQTISVDTELQENLCGNCTLCIDRCPTHAIVSPGMLDARKCISYQTIEDRGTESANALVENRIFGCDACADVCPWNKKLISSHWIDFHPSKEFLALKKNNWKDLDPTTFNNIFSLSPINRAGFDHIKKIIS